MLFKQRHLSYFAGLALLAVPFAAQAADMSGADITKLVTGNTAYIQFDGTTGNTGAGLGFIYYATDGKIATKFPNGNALKGVWVIKDNTSCITFDGRPPNPCTKYDKEGDVITLINTADGKARGKIVKFAAGNPEKL